MIKYPKIGSIIYFNGKIVMEIFNLEEEFLSDTIGLYIVINITKEFDDYVQKDYVSYWLNSRYPAAVSNREFEKGFAKVICE
jgi:hypothetical protein